MDFYKDTLFVQSGSLHDASNSFALELDSGSIFFALSDDSVFLDYCHKALRELQKKDTYTLNSIVNNIISSYSDFHSDMSVIFALLTNDVLECISQNTPSVLLVDKEDSVYLTDISHDLSDVKTLNNLAFAISLSKVGMFIFVDNKKVMYELKDKHLIPFAKCELEHIIGSLVKKNSDNSSYFLINNTLKDKVRFNFTQKLPAKLKNIIKYEMELEKLLNDSYPKNKEANDSALVVFNELILNAYEHGTLGVDSATKQEKMLWGELEEYVEELEKDNDGVIDITIIIYEQNLLKITIKDYGDGFNFKQYNCKKEDVSLKMLQGRGIQMANQMGAIVYFEDNGSKVTFFIDYNKKTRKISHYKETEILKNMSILYVEDDDFIRKQFSKIIQRMVKNISVAADGKEGLALYKIEHPDIVLTDIEMPRMNGLAMTQKIKEINPEQPILITTAYNQDENFLKAIDLGVDKYVIKPVKISQLKASLLTIAKQLFYKKEALRLLSEKEQKDSLMLTNLQAKNRYAIAQQNMAFEKQQLIIHDDSRKYRNHYRCKILYKPLERLSGDIYGVYKIDEDNTVLYIVDGMGKGLVASVTAVLSAAYINRAIEISIVKKNFDFEKLVIDYQDYIKSYLADEECVSFVMIHLNFKKNTFQHGSFGMYPIVVKNCETLEVLEYNSNNPPYMKYSPILGTSKKINLPEKFDLFVFSDGLVETEFFSMQELILYLKSNKESKKIALFEKLMDKNFIADDDLSLIHFSKN